MSNLKLYRKRFIPNETVWLKDDVVELRSEKCLVTSWKTLRPKNGFSHGCSCYFLEKGLKISKLYRADDSLSYYYCDIVEFTEDLSENSLTVTDLLADVILYPDGTYQVMDLDELAEAFETGLICAEQLTKSLRLLNQLLQIIQDNAFYTLLEELEKLGL